MLTFTIKAFPITTKAKSTLVLLLFF